MSGTVISVANLWKEYRLGVISHHTLASDLQSWWARLCGKEDPNTQLGAGCFQAGERFWALQDISFKVSRGDILGIIGRNGAGKSTLLKILSQVTAPSRGEVRIKGRIASLLEVGTGFHPELTGRENIFLNGAILGMSKADIRRKLDEIVAFAEIDKFVDTPVKRYSSGMYVRLAFAVAAHLEPEILIVDEVLAVGDAQFQKKCLGKMEDVSGKEGRTVLFVSHNMGAVRQLCNSALVLAQGQVCFSGMVDDSIAHYLQSYQEVRFSQTGPLASNDSFRIKLEQFEIRNGRGERVVSAEIGTETVFDFILSSERSYARCHFVIAVDSAEDIRVCALHNTIAGQELTIEPPVTRVRCIISRMSLVSGHYRITLKLRVGDDTVLYLPKFFDLHVESGDFYETGKLPESSWGGLCLVDNRWEALPCDQSSKFGLQEFGGE